MSKQDTVFYALVGGLITLFVLLVLRTFSIDPIEWLLNWTASDIYLGGSKWQQR